MAGHLHHHGVHPSFHHQRQQGLQIGRFGCGQRARLVLPCDPDADGTDQPRDAVGGPQPGLHQIGSGGLARRTGHPDHPKVPRRIAVHGRRQPAQHRPRVGMNQHRHGRVRAHVGDSVRIGEHRDRTARDGVVRVVPAVRRRARQRGEQVPRLGVLAAQRDTRDDDFPHPGGVRDDRAYPIGQWPERLAGGMRGTQLHGLDTVPAATAAAPPVRRVRWLAMSAAGRGRVTAARSLAAAASSRCCGTAAPSSCPAVPRRCGAGCRP